MSAIHLFLEENEKIKIKYKNILIEKDIQIQIYKLEELLNENNTEPEIILKYLELKQEIKDEKLPELLDIYKDCIYYETFNNKFGKVKTKKSFILIIKELFDELKPISDEQNDDKKIESIKKIAKRENKKYNKTFPLFFEINKELYFNSLYYRFLKKIKRVYNDSNKKKIFIKYINNLSTFIHSIYDNFFSYFEKNDIFLLEKYDSKQKNDIIFFSYFFSFLINFNFNIKDYGGFNLYINIFNDSLNHEFYEEIVNIITNDYISYEKIGKNLEIKYSRDNYQILNIENYYIRSLLYEIGNEIVENFILDRYLRINYYDTDLYIKKHWSILSHYLNEILCSKTIKSILVFLYSDDKIFLDNIIMIDILNDIRFFNFSTNYFCKTEKKYLTIYMRSFPSNRNLDEHNQIIYLTTFLISCIHEIIGNLFLLIYNYFNKKNQINSIKSKNFNLFNKEKKFDSNIEELLFGDYKSQMTLNQMLFALDIKNYSVDYKKFRNNYHSNGNNTNLENISKELEKILNIYEIEFDEFDLQIGELYFVSQYNKDSLLQFKIPPRHSIKKLLEKKLYESNEE